MALTKYVSAEWVDPPFEGGARMIKAIGDDGQEYWLPGEDSTTIDAEGKEVVKTVAEYDVPPWPAFVATNRGATFLKAKP